MRMYALYFKFDAELLACVSGHRMDFYRDAEPVLYASAEKLEALLRRHATKEIPNKYFIDVNFNVRDMGGPLNYHGWPAIPGCDDINNFVIVPMDIVPNMAEAYTYKVPKK